MTALYCTGRVLVAVAAGILWLIAVMLWVSAVVALFVLSVFAAVAVWAGERVVAWRS